MKRGGVRRYAALEEIPLFKDVTYGEWSDWRWQWRNRIEDVGRLAKVPLSERRRRCQHGAQEVRMSPPTTRASQTLRTSAPPRRQAVPQGAGAGEARSR